MTFSDFTDDEILAAHAAANMPPNTLDPVTVRDLVEKLTNQELCELSAYACHAQSPEDFAIRTSSWLIRKFNLQTKGATHAC